MGAMEYVRSLLDLVHRAGKILLVLLLPFGLFVIDYFEQFIKDHLPKEAGPVVEALGAFSVPAFFIAVIGAMFLAYHELRREKVVSTATPPPNLEMTQTATGETRWTVPINTPTRLLTTLAKNTTRPAAGSDYFLAAPDAVEPEDSGPNESRGPE